VVVGCQYCSSVLLPPPITVELSTKLWWKLSSLKVGWEAYTKDGYFMSSFVLLPPPFCELVA